MKISELFLLERNPRKGLMAAEWAGVGYLLLTLVAMCVLWGRLVNPESMLRGRVEYAVVTAALWLVYRLLPCRLTVLARVLAQMLFLSFWYSDTYELNRLLPNLDPFFATLEQQLFGCQPALLFSAKMPWTWCSELMCMGYTSYFPLIAVVASYYYFQRYQEFGMASFVILGSFFTYYVIFDLLPVTGPQFYYLAVGTERIAQGVFPDVGNWFLTHRDMMDAPGWTDGFWYHMLQVTHDAGERPTAAFPSSHVGVTTVIFLLALRTRNRRLVLLLLPFCLLLCLSTVYILAHYAVDVLGGLLSGTLFYLLFSACYRRLHPDGGKRR